MQQRAKRLGAKCDICPLRGREPVLGEGPMGAAMAVVGEAPGREEVKHGRPFIGKSGEALDGYLSQVGMPRSAVFISNAVACFPDGGDFNVYLTIAKKAWKEAHGSGKNAKPFPSPLDCCRPRLFNELRIRRCKQCGQFEQGPMELQCVCANPLLIPRSPPTVIVPMGNAAMESVLGFDGISKWRGSALPFKRGR